MSLSSSFRYKNVNYAIRNVTFKITNQNGNHCRRNHTQNKSLQDS